MVKSHKVAPFLFLLLFSCVQKNLLPDAKDAKRTNRLVWAGVHGLVRCGSAYSKGSMNNYYKGIGKSLPGYSRNLAVEAFTTFVTTGVNEFFSAAMIAAGVEKELGAVVSKDYKDKQGVATDLVVSLGEIACESSGNSKQVGFLEKLGAGFPSLLDKNGEREKVFFKVCDAGLSCFENKEKLQLFLGKSDSKVAVDALHDFVKNGRKFHKPVAGVLTSLTYKKWLSKYKKSKSPWVVALAKTSDCAIKAVLSTMIGDGFKKYIAK